MINVIVKCEQVKFGICQVLIANPRKMLTIPIFETLIQYSYWNSALLH